MTISHPNARFAIGTKFKTLGKHPKECTVTNILRTYDNADKLVKVSYVATHEFCGQVITDHDVCDTTIARGLISKPPLAAKGE